MPVPIPPLREENLPERKLSFWQLAGPGAIMIGLAVGAGELAVWPWVTAKFGTVMLWAAALGVFLQLWINIEIGRWAVVTGEHPFTSYARMSMTVIYAFLTLGFVGLFLPGWARMSGAALKALIFGPDGPGPEWFWTAVTFGFIALILFGPKQMYKAVERSIGIMVLVITIGLVYVAFSVGTWDAVKEMGRGLVNFGHIELDDEFTFARFFGAVVFAGIGGTGNLYYAFYLRDKNIGMGKRIPVLANPLRQHKTAEVQTGFRYPENPENASRFRRWMRYVIQDQVLFFWLGNTFTMFLFMFGALAVLRPAGIVPAEGQIVWDMSVILESSLGAPGRYVFLLIGMAALFSSQLAAVDGGARTWSYLLGSMFKFGKKRTQSQWYLTFAIMFMVAGTASTAFFELSGVSALGFIFNAALLGGFAMAIYVPLTLYVNLTRLPKSARPKALNIVMMLIASGVYVSFTLFTIWNLISG